MKGFASFHPALLFLYYVFVVVITVFFMHPVVLVCSLFGSLLFFYMLTDTKQFLKDVGFYFIVFLLITITNPIFVHRGETILFFYNDQPITLEAILYGAVLGTMLVSVIFWSKSYSKLMTSDKFVYLFGKIIPKLSLVLSMALKFIPMFKMQIKKVNATQKTLGLYTTNSYTDRLIGSIRVFNSILTWSLENAIIQADAMKARGYGLKGRTNFSIFRFTKRDAYTLVCTLLLFILIMYQYIQGTYQYFYYPKIESMTWSNSYIIHYLVIWIFTIFPFIFELKESIQWKLLQSKMYNSPIQMQRKEH